MKECLSYLPRELLEKIVITDENKILIDGKKAGSITDKEIVIYERIIDELTITDYKYFIAKTNNEITKVVETTSACANEPHTLEQRAYKINHTLDGVEKNAVNFYRTESLQSAFEGLSSSSPNHGIYYDAIDKKILQPGELCEIKVSRGEYTFMSVSMDDPDMVKVHTYNPETHSLDEPKYVNSRGVSIINAPQFTSMSK